MQYGLQMYTLRQLTDKHMAQALEQVTQMGYTGVELAGFGDLTPDEMVQAVRRNGLTVISAHVGYQDLQPATAYFFCMRASAASQSALPESSA